MARPEWLLTEDQMDMSQQYFPLLHLPHILMTVRYVLNNLPATYLVLKLCNIKDNHKRAVVCYI